jgi:hypothetical protein
LASAARNMPHGSVGAPPERGAGVYADRSGAHQSRSGHVSALDPRLGHTYGRGTPRGAGRTPSGGGGSGSHSRGPVRTRGGPGPTWRSELYIQGSDTLSWGSRLTVDALDYITFSGHVAALEPPTWWGRMLLLAQSSHPRLGRVTAWPHTKLLYHTTKDSCVGTVSSYCSKGYPSFRIPTVAPGPPQGRMQTCRWGQSLYFASTWPDW